MLFVFMVHFLSSSLIKAGNKPPPATPGKPKKATTFQEFESITSDAWDVGDDDDDLLAMAAHNLNIEVVMETANKVNKFSNLLIVLKLYNIHYIVSRSVVIWGYNVYVYIFYFCFVAWSIILLKEATAREYCFH